MLRTGCRWRSRWGKVRRCRRGNLCRNTDRQVPSPPPLPSQPTPPLPPSPPPPPTRALWVTPACKNRTSPGTMQLWPMASGNGRRESIKAPTRSQTSWELPSPPYPHRPSPVPLLPAVTAATRCGVGCVNAAVQDGQDAELPSTTSENSFLRRLGPPCATNRLPRHPRVITLGSHVVGSWMGWGVTCAAAAPSSPAAAIVNATAITELKLF